MKPAHLYSIFASFLLILIWSNDASAADSFTKGHGALEVFDDGGLEFTPLWVKIWLGFMMLCFASGLAFVRHHVIPRWVVGGFILGMVSGGAIFTALGLPWLGGAIAIVHIIFWTPGFILLVKDRPFLNGELGLAFRSWSAAMTFTIAFSFVFDIRDAALYIQHFISVG